MSETAKLRNLITKRGTLEILIPLCSIYEALTARGQELVESVVGILQWMRKWGNRKH